MDSIIDLFWKKISQDPIRVEKIKDFIRLNLRLKNLPEVVSRKYGVSLDKARKWISWVDLWYSEKEKKAQKSQEEVSESKHERRFRGSIYVDIWVPLTEDLEQDREVAEDYLKEYQKEVPNSCIGRVAVYNPGLVDSLDKEI